MNAQITAMNTRTNTTNLPTCQWNDINEPGCYLVFEWGCLVRVPKDGVAEGRSPKITFCGNTTVSVCKLSDDPYLPISKARQLAADNDCPVCF